MISRTAEYALRASLFLAQRPGLSATAQEIAGATGVPARYLAKVLQQLVGHNILTSRRGPAGGFKLAKDPIEISVLDIVRSVDPLRKTDSDVLQSGKPCLGSLYGYLKQLEQLAECSMQRVSIERLTHANPDQEPLVAAQIG